MPAPKAFVPIRYLTPWPEDFFRFSSADSGIDMVDRVGLTTFEFDDSVPDKTILRAGIALLDEVSIEIPGLDGFALVFGAPSTTDPAGPGAEFNLVVGLVDPLLFGLTEVDIALRMRQDLLRPVVRDASGKWVPEVGPDGSPRPFELRLVGVNLFVDDEGDVDVAFPGGAPGIAINAFMIGGSGIVVEPDQPVTLPLSRKGNPPPGRSAGWRGVYIPHATIHLPDVDFPAVPAGLEFTDCYIGSGGFSGEVTVNWASGDAEGSLFGTALSLARLEMKFEQSTPVDMEIEGQITLPFFDQPLGIDIGIGVDGSLSVALSTVQPPGVIYQSGLVTFEKEDLLRLTLDSLVFQVQEGVFTAKLSGQVKPLFGEDEGLDWPSFQVKELAIDSEGNVHLEGGWLDLREQYSLDFHGFQMEITKLGFGKTEEGGKWIGFSGGLKLVDGLPVGTSVEGLRITWYDDGRDTKITFNGIGVELDVPEVLRFKGAVSYHEDTNRFDGGIKLDLISLDLQVDGMLVVSQQDGANYMAIYLATELPSGIPLWSTGLALYGMAGLFALEMEPDKRDHEGWYESPDGSNGWYQRTPVGITDLENKWEFSPNALALGAGVTIGTVSDNGYAFSGKMLLAIIFPGPILLIEGKANLLKERAKLDGAEPNFRALAVLDNRAGTFLIGLDAQYKHDEGGKLIDIRGSAEAFFDFDDASLWHFYLGERESREKRIRAEIFRLFEAEAYFMLDATQLAMGTWVGYDEHWKFGPLRVEVEAWIEGNAVVNWKPRHFHGDLWLHGKAELAVWRFDTGLTVNAQIAADVLDPFHILGEFSVGINLPWPLPDFDVDILLEWGPELIPPPLPLPLKEIAIEHFKVTTSWPLPRPTLLLPNYDRGEGFLVDEPPVFDENAEPPPGMPVVPLDCRPHVTFGRAVHDDAFVGINPQPLNPEWERIGDPVEDKGPVKVRYGLKGVALHKRVGGIPEPWKLVAHKGSTGPVDDALDVKELFGSWAPVPAMPDGGGEAVAQTKLWLWSKTPFDYTRHTGRAWNEWFTDRFSDYPCVPNPPDREICCDFEKIVPGQELTLPWQCPDYPGLALRWLAPAVQMVTVLDQPVEGLTHALCFSQTVAAPNEITIQLREPARAVKITLVDAKGAQATGFDAQGNAHGPFFGGLPDDPHIEVMGENLIRVVVRGNSDTCILQICLVLGPDPEEVTRREEMEQHLRDELARWAQEGEVLEPHTTYRLKVVTTLKAEGEEELAGFSKDLEQIEYAYFRTEGPPGLIKLSTPIGHPTPDEFDRGLDDLSRYVRQTVPATVPEVWEKPLLLRPVYRAYDVGVEFNENYVDLMYRLERRDLGLYLYDNNNRPVRDVQGRLIVLNNRWGVTEELTLTESDERWITVVNASDCATLDTTIIPHTKTLTSAAAGQVLDPDTVYEARLVPLLLHEDFGAYLDGTGVNGPSETLDGWTVHDEGTNAAPSHWKIREEGDPPSHYLVQTSNIWGGTMAGTDPRKPGTMLLRADHPHVPSDHPDQPGNWTDYRLSVYLRSSDDDAIGAVFRYVDSDYYYRFSIDRQRKYRRLVRVVDGVHSILAEDDFVYRQDQDYLLTIEAIGALLRVYQDGALVFDVTDDSIDRGRIGLYCWGNTGARFSDVRVDDFRTKAPIVYRFKFTTSQFANFFHHLHSFQDEIWRMELAMGEPPIADIAALMAQAVTPDTTPSDDEARAYDTFAAYVLGTAAHQNPPEVQVTRLEQAGEALAFLIQSPEPIDWSRTELEILRAEHRLSPPKLPGAVKLTDVTFGTAQPNEESVTLLLREATDLTAHRIEYRRFPGPVAEPTDYPVLFADEFDSADSGLLFREAFGPNALDHYTIVDEGTNLGPSAWAVSDGHIVQTSNIYGGSVSAAVPDKPGTMAITGSASWDNVRISAALRSGDNDAIGMVFRYQDTNHYYRFSMDQERSYRRLIKKVDGVVTVLWEDNVPYNIDQSYQLSIGAYGNQLLGYVDNVLLFNVQDADIGAGRVGFYCWANTAAQFEALSVEALESPPVLWQPAFTDLSEIEIVDAPEAIDGTSEWAVADGILTQSSNIHVEDYTPHRPGTFALGGSDNWEDVQISVRLRSDDDGAIGVMFRLSPQVSPEADESEPVQDYHYYRFSMDRTGSYRRLVKKANDTVTVLWQDGVQFTVSQSYELTIRAVGSELRGYLDGVALFTVHDGDLKRGRLGLYCSTNTGARFERVIVTNHARRVGRWTVHDEGAVSGPSIWEISNGALLQTSNIYGGAAPAYPGTHVTAGDRAWADYRLTVRMNSDDDDGMGIMVRYVDDENYYRLSMDAQRNYQRLIKNENGVVTTLWEDAGGYTVDEPFTLTVDAIGSRLVGFLGNTRLFDLVDSTHAAGQVGLYCWGNTGARFERVEVRRPPLETDALLRDRFADGDTSDWSVVDEGTVAAPSNWITFEGTLRQTSNIYGPPNDRDSLDKRGTHAVAGDPTWSDVVVRVRVRSLDNDAIGLLLRYTDANHYYRFSMDSQRSYRRLVKNVGGTFSLLWEDKFAYEVGRTYEVTVVATGSILRAYLDGVPMFVVEDSDLAAGRIGLYCWGNTDARFSDVRVYPADLAFDDWLLDEPFDVLISGRWIFVDEGDHEGPSQWEVTEGELRQTSNIFGESTDGSVLGKPGTYALGGDAAWTNCRVSVRLRSDDNDAIGVMFRYQDADNYYRFSMDQQHSYRRLIKKVAGEVTLLWEDAAQYTLGREYILTLDCVGERLTGYLDGVPLFTVEDAALATGRIGLYCWSNTGAHFAEVRVAAPAWVPYYVFPHEARLPAGTRVQVYAGHAADAPPEETGVVRRFIASLDERSELRLPTEGVDLRMRAPGGTDGHGRRFLPDSDYAPVDGALVLRKGDGTGFFLLPSTPGSALTSGQYRLKMTYRRDNRANAPDSQLFSQAGVADPEQVTIDIP